jgi:CHAT domain-containing protein/cytochrome c-type biogenesis protein CcmH/NrfG
LTRPFDKHLDSDELDRLISLPETSGSGSEQLSEFALGEAQRHVESCQACSRKLQRHKFVHSEILRMRAPNSSPPTPECLGDAEWLEVAAGLLPEAKTRALMKHAAQCGHCGPLLKNAAEAIAEEATPGEEALLASLQSARPAWRKNMASILRDGVRERQQKPSWRRAVFAWPTPAYVFAGIAAVAVVAWIGVRALHPPSAEQLLAQAYSEHRTLEVRIPGAKYAPVQAQRGTVRSDFDKPQSLLKAEDLIGENLRKNPNDPVWLQERARADLLNGNYDSAIKSLDKALETVPDSPGLLTDLGSAYFARAESADRSIDYGDAIESFGKALAKSPDDPIALFNRALACERLFLYTQAVDDWQHYLRIDPQGDWSNDARARLAALQKKIKQHEQSENEPLMTPEEIATAGVDDVGVREKIDRRVEDYLNIAVMDWLPNAYPIAGQQSVDQSSGARTSLAVLADLAVQKHRDRWLADLVASGSSANFSLAVEHLSAALKANGTGDNVAARSHAMEAGRLFASERNDAGVLRARVEYMFASQDAQDGSGCLKAASGLGSRLQRYSYSWLQAQFLIESGNCTWISGNLGDVQKLFLRAAQQAEHAAYGIIYLRTQDHLSLLAGTVGDLPAAWARTQKALLAYWAGVYPAMRGYNLYYDRYELASSTKQSHLQMAILRDAVALTESFDDNLLRAMAHVHMANAALELAEMEPAETEYTEASRLFSASPQIESTQIARLEAETRIAGVEIYQGKTQLAIDRLRQKAPEIAQHPTNYLSILYYSTLGEAETQAGHTQEADSALRLAVGLAERRLHSLHDDKSRIEWVEQSAAAYRNLVQERLLQGDAEGALELWESFRGAELSAVVSVRSGSPELSQLHEVASRLPSLTKKTVIAYAVLPRGLAAWVYDDRGVWSGWIQGNPKEIQTQVERFRTLCSDFTSEQSDVERNARNLYQILFAPIEKQIPSGRLLIIDADDALAEIPFEALADSQGHYLADRFSIVASRGIYYRGDLREAASIEPDSVAMIAAVPSPAADLYSPLNPLPDALAEADAVASGFVSVHLLQGGQATAKAIADGLPNAQLFHFAGHALASASHSGLLLSDSFLSAAELRRIPISKLRLAVLSACETQDYSAGEGGDGDGLVRVFLAAGVPNVVASRWSVDSSATRQFMELFYQNLLAGSSVADSIRQARISLRSRSGMSHPFYWAAFTDFGLV